MSSTLSNPPVSSKTMNIKNDDNLSNIERDYIFNRSKYWNKEINNNPKQSNVKNILLDIQASRDTYSMMNWTDKMGVGVL